MKRGRNQRRRQGFNPNRALDSNGPDVRIRGTAQQIYDKYLSLARDSNSSGDRVKAENYLQHAEHYFRVLRALQPSQSPQSEFGADQGGDDFDGDQPSLHDNADSRFSDPRPPSYREQGDGGGSGQGEASDGQRQDHQSRHEHQARPEHQQRPSNGADHDGGGEPQPSLQGGERPNGERGDDRDPRRRRRRRRPNREFGGEGQQADRPEPVGEEEPVG